jgi:hypothetical protein
VWPVPQRAELRGVDQKTAEAKPASVALHKPRAVSKHFDWESRNPAIGNGWKKKKIRAAHAKEKQQIRETCNRPNRLNLLNWTVGGG